MSRVWERVMVAHRQYTAGFGDALAGSLTYALLICVGPAVLLLSTVVGGLGWPGLRETVARAAEANLPVEVSGYLGDLPAAGLPLTLGLLVALVWTSLRLVRALRTSVRAMCGQPAGSGNPVRDALRDAVLGALLLAALTVVALLAAAGAGRWWGLPAVTVATTALFAAIMLRGSWPGRGRPALAAALPAAFVAALAVDGLTLLARAYVDATAAVHDAIYRTASGLVVALVWTSLCCRALLRATAWAATKIPLTGQISEFSRKSDRSAVGGERRVSEQQLWVVVPAYNEAATIGDTLAALAVQTDRDFQLVVVDNGSTDDTGDVVWTFAKEAPFPVEVVNEPERGAGTAADTGFRFAIDRGGTHLLRTDADCVPAPTWVAEGRAAFASGADMVCGRSRPRPDERPNPLERWLLPAVIRVLAVYGRYRREHRHPRFRAPYVLCHGHNIGITAELYLRCGGTQRQRLQDGSEDVILLNRARVHSDRIVRSESMVVATSLRRLRAWGVRRTLLWHWDRRYVPETESGVHVR